MQNSECIDLTAPFDLLIFSPSQSLCPLFLQFFRLDPVSFIGLMI